MSRSKFWLCAASTMFVAAIPLTTLSVIASLIAYWGFGVDRIHSAFFGENFIVFAEKAPVEERRLYGLLASLPALAFWLYAMWRLFVLFLTFNAGILVGVETIRHLRAFSLFSILAGMAGFAFSGVMRWAAGVFDDAPLWTHLGFSTTHMAIVLASAITYFASHIIEEGYGYKKETEEYV